MRVHGALGKDEHHARSTGAALRPFFQLESCEVRNEVRLPHVAAGPHRDEVALPAEETLCALPLRELVGVLKDEALVVEQVEHHAEIVGGGEARALPAAGVEMLVPGIERQREQAL